MTTVITETVVKTCKFCGGLILEKQADADYCSRRCKCAHCHRTQPGYCREHYVELRERQEEQLLTA